MRPVWLPALDRGLIASVATGHGSGLTTAASIWSTAAVGIAAGVGHYALEVGATVLQLIMGWGLA